jgi:hypothetical protein
MEEAGIAMKCSDKCPMLDDAMELIMRAAPLAWLFNEYDEGEYTKSAHQWEKDAEALLVSYRKASDKKGGE